MNFNRDTRAASATHPKKKSPTGQWSSPFKTTGLQRLSRSSHTLRMHILSLEQIQVHLTKTVSKHHPYQLRVLQPVIFLLEISAFTKLIRPPGPEDIRHRYRHRRGIVLQKCLLHRQIDAIEGLDIAL